MGGREPSTKAEQCKPLGGQQAASGRSVLKEQVRRTGSLWSPRLPHVDKFSNLVAYVLRVEQCAISIIINCAI